MGNGSHARVLGADMVVLKFTSEKMVLLKNVQHVSSIKKNLVSASQMCRDGFKLCLSLINVLCRDMEHLLEKVMIAETCSAYLCLMKCVIK